MSRETEYGPTPTAPPTIDPLGGDPVAFYKSLAPSDRGYLYSAYIEQHLNVPPNKVNLFDTVDKLSQQSKDFRPGIEKLLFEEFGPPAQLSKGEMMRRDARRRAKGKNVGKRTVTRTPETFKL